MFRARFLTCIAILTIATPFSLYADKENTPVDTLAASVTEAANADEISNEDLAIRYSVYRGTYLYGTKFNFDDANDYGIIFDKQRKIADKLAPSREKNKLGVLINETFKKYEDVEKYPLDDNTKSKFLEECDSIVKGIRNAID